MKSIALLLFISVEVLVAEVCPENQIACPNGEKCIPYGYICDNDNDCHDNSDEDPELCTTWKNTSCPPGSVQCTRYGETKCIEISEFCASESPRCEGELDRRICSMLKEGRIGNLSTFSLPNRTETTVSNFDQSIEFGKKFESALPHTMSHASCPMLYTRVGEECLSFFYVGGMSWGESRAFCNVLGGDLLTFKNAVHYVKIIQHLQSQKLTSDFWIGGSIENTTAGWRWLNGSPMEMGSPFWATRYSLTCIQRNVTTATSETICDRYYQAPEKVMKGQCASLSYEHSFTMTDEDCLRTMSPLCIYQGRDLPTTSKYSQFPSQNIPRRNQNWHHGYGHHL